MEWDKKALRNLLQERLLESYQDELHNLNETLKDYEEDSDEVESQSP